MGSTIDISYLEEPFNIKDFIKYVKKLEKKSVSIEINYMEQTIRRCCFKIGWEHLPKSKRPLEFSEISFIEILRRINIG